MHSKNKTLLDRSRRKPNEDQALFICRIARHLDLSRLVPPIVLFPIGRTSIDEPQMTIPFFEWMDVQKYGCL
jgi:hypothetical protein